MAALGLTITLAGLTITLAGAEFQCKHHTRSNAMELLSKLSDYLNCTRQHFHRFDLTINLTINPKSQTPSPKLKP